MENQVPCCTYTIGPAHGKQGTRFQERSRRTREKISENTRERNEEQQLEDSDGDGNDNEVVD